MWAVDFDAYLGLYLKSSATGFEWFRIQDFHFFHWKRPTVVAGLGDPS